MSNEVKEEKILYEGNIKYNGTDSKLVLTEKNIIIKQKKGLFVKKLKEVKNIIIKDIKLIDDEAVIKHDNKNITIETNNSTFSFETENVLEASKIVSKLKELRTGSNALGRAKLKFDKFAQGALGTVVTAGVGWAIKHPKEVKKAATTVVKTAKTIITKGK